MNKYAGILLVMAIGGMAEVANAVTCTYDGNWDTVPSAVSDDVVVASGTLEWGDDLPDSVFNFTLNGGTVTLAKDFAIANNYTQNAGTFTCGAHIFTIGKKGATVSPRGTSYGHFYLNAGTFNAPVGNVFRYWSRSHQVYFRVEDAATFTTSDTDMDIYIASQGGTMTYRLGGATFRDFRILSPGSALSTDTNISIWGTNAVTRLLTLGGGHFSGAKNVNYGSAQLDVYGDVIVTNHMNCTTYFINFCGTGDQRVEVAVPTTETSYVVYPGVLVDKPSGKLTVTGGKWSVVDQGDFGHSCYGFCVKRGEVDMSGLEMLYVSNYNCNNSVDDANATVKWPQTVYYYGYKPWGTIKNQHFNNLRIAPTDSRVSFGAGTNTVHGNFRSSAGSFTGTSSCLIVEGDVIADDTYSAAHASTYGGGSGWLILTNGNDQVISITNTSLVSLKIDKPANSKVTVHAKDGNLFLGVHGGSYDGSGGCLTLAGGVLDVSEGGIYTYGTHGNTLKRTGGDILWGTNGLAVKLGTGGHITTINLGSDIVVPKFSTLGAKGGNHNINITGTLNVSNFVQNGGSPKNGTINIHGDHYLYADTKVGTSNIRYCGTADQHFWCEEGAIPNYGSGFNTQVIKTGGRLILDSDYLITGWNQQYVGVSGGTVDLNGHVFASGGTMQIENGGTIFQPAKGGQCRGATMNIYNGGKIAFELSNDEREPILYGANIMYPNELHNNPASITNWVEIVGEVRSSYQKRVTLADTKGEISIYAVGARHIAPPIQYVLPPRITKKSVSYGEKTIADELHRCLFFDWMCNEGTMVLLR